MMMNERPSVGGHGDARQGVLSNRVRTPTEQVDYNTYHSTRTDDVDLEEGVEEYFSDDEEIQHHDQLIYSRYTKRGQQFFHFLNVGVPILIVLLIAVGCVLAVIISRSYTGGSVTSSVSGDNGAVAADDPVCSEYGLDILKKGGNAVDAAVTTALCLGVMRPYASGIGGGGFIMIHMSQTNQTEFIDCRETAPAASTYDMFYDNYEAFVRGGKAIAVPGEPAGLFAAFSKFGSGKLKWADVLQGPINLARNGFTVDEMMEIRIRQGKDDIAKNPGLAKIFMDNGRYKVRGDTIKRPEYANTLERLAKDGVTPFYTGDLATTMVAEIKAAGGIITEADFANYKPISRFSADAPAPQVGLENMTSWYGNGRYKVVGGPPPSSGAAVAFMLNMIDRLKLEDSNMDYGLRYHYIIEALKFGFANRMGLGDLPFLPIENVTAVVHDKLLNADFARQLSAANIDPSRTYPWKYYFQEPNPFENSKDSGTTHFTVIDKDRNTVAMTTTVNTLFGSQVVSAATGVIFNNQMNDFSVTKDAKNLFNLPPSISNRIAPGKRPLSSMSPTIVFDTQKNNRVAFVLGGSGGPTIVSSVLQVLVDVLDLELDPQVAINLPRVHVQVGQEPVSMEEGLSVVLQKGIVARGHSLFIAPILPDGHTIGCVQAIRVVDKDDKSTTLVAAADTRKAGRPATY